MSLPPILQNAIEPMQLDAAIEENENNEEQQIIVDNPNLDLEVYAGSYAGLARIYRLIFVADVCPSLRVEALKMAIGYVMTTYNVTLYQVLHKKLGDMHTNSQSTIAGAASTSDAPPVNGAIGIIGLPDIAAQPPPPPAFGAVNGHNLPLFDPNWVETKSKMAVLKLEKYDSDLKNYKSNSIKESIRRGHDDLGEHYLNCGDLSNALKCFSRARDYCTSGKHVIHMCLNVIKVSIYLQNWSHVLSYVSKAESTPDYRDGTKATITAVYSRLKCAAGLAELQLKKYKSAAKHFLMANFDTSDFPELMSHNNVAMYGGLCALATYDRQDLMRSVITSNTFKLFLELEPQLRDIILKFHESKYACCLSQLDEIRESLLLDMYIAPHVNILYQKIRNRSLIQYFSPYAIADMHKMANAFNRNVISLENELIQLILDGQINARIDSHNKILYAKEADKRNSTFERALMLGEDYQRRSRMLVLRAAMFKSHICVKNIPPRDNNSDLCNSAGSATNSPTAVNNT